MSVPHIRLAWRASGAGGELWLEPLSTGSRTLSVYVAGPGAPVEEDAGAALFDALAERHIGRGDQVGALCILGCNAMDVVMGGVTLRTAAAQRDALSRFRADCAERCRNYGSFWGETARVIEALWAVYPGRGLEVFLLRGDSDRPPWEWEDKRLEEWVRRAGDVAAPRVAVVTPTGQGFPTAAPVTFTTPDLLLRDLAPHGALPARGDLTVRVPAARLPALVLSAEAEAGGWRIERVVDAYLLKVRAMSPADLRKPLPLAIAPGAGVGIRFAPVMVTPVGGADADTGRAIPG